MDFHEGVVHRGESGLLAAKPSNCGLDFGITAYGKATGSTASALAPAANEPRKNSPPPGAVSGLNIIPARLMPGAISLRRPSHLPPKPASV